jgi:hypothetical protein
LCLYLSFPAVFLPRKTVTTVADATTVGTVANRTGEIVMGAIAAIAAIIGATIAVAGVITGRAGTVTDTIGKGYRCLYEEWPAIRS